MSRSALTRQSLQKSLAMRQQPPAAEVDERRVKQDELPLCVCQGMFFSM